MTGGLGVGGCGDWGVGAAEIGGWGLGGCGDWGWGHKETIRIESKAVLFASSTLEARQPRVAEVAVAMSWSL